MKDEILRQRTEKEIEDGQELIRRIDQDGEIVGYMTILIMVIAESEEELQRRCKKIEGKLMGMQMKIRKIANRNVPLSTFVGGLPFASNGFNDNNGYYFARDTEGGIVVLDSWKRGGDRTNSNYVIMGTAGVGKSTVAKHLILNEYMTGTKLLAIDPERRV